MPELPEVETIKRGLEPLIVHKKVEKVIIDSTTPKSFQGKAEAIIGATVMGIRRRGKALLIDFDNGKTAMIHLRMTGQLIWRSDALGELPAAEDMALVASKDATQQLAKPTGQIADPAQLANMTKYQFAAGHPSKNFTAALPNGQTRVTFVFGDGKLYFNDQRKFGFVKVLPTEAVEQDKFISELAKEPWQMSVQELCAACQRHKKAPIKAVLLDQKVIAGLGNIYADESLFYASVHPTTPAGALSEPEIAKILEGACKVMDASIASGGSTMATYIKPDGTTGDYLELFAKVFHREGKPCERCGTTIIKTRVAGRGTHLCPECQKVKGVQSKGKPSNTSQQSQTISTKQSNTNSVKDMSTKKMPLKGTKKA